MMRRIRKSAAQAAAALSEPAMAVLSAMRAGAVLLYTDWRSPYIRLGSGGVVTEEVFFELSDLIERISRRPVCNSYAWQYTYRAK